MRIDNPLTAYRVTQIIEALHGGALNVDEVTEVLCLHPHHVGRYLQQLHAAGAIYISDWAVRTHGRATRLAVYKLGNKPDAPRPANLTPQQRQAKYKARLRADAELFDKHKALDRARKRRVVRDPFVAAFFGTGRAAEVRA